MARVYCARLDCCPPPFAQKSGGAPYISPLPFSHGPEYTLINPLIISGHNKWSNIKHIKAAKDQIKSKELNIKLILYLLQVFLLLYLGFPPVYSFWNAFNLFWIIYVFSLDLNTPFLASIRVWFPNCPYVQSVFFPNRTPQSFAPVRFHVWDQFWGSTDNNISF